MRLRICLRPSLPNPVKAAPVSTARRFASRTWPQTIALLPVRQVRSTASAMSWFAFVCSICYGHRWDASCVFALFTIPALWLPLQDRVGVPTSRSYPGRLCLSLLDAWYEATAPWQRRSVFVSNIRPVPGSPTQKAACLSPVCSAQPHRTRATSALGEQSHCASLALLSHVENMAA